MKDDVFLGGGLSYFEPLEVYPCPGLISHKLLFVLPPQFLDLFSGSGSVGVEALSRGAGHATFVDFAKDCCEVKFSSPRVVPEESCTPPPPCTISDNDCCRDPTPVAEVCRLCRRHVATRVGWDGFHNI